MATAFCLGQPSEYMSHSFTWINMNRVMEFKENISSESDHTELEISDDDSSQDSEFDNGIVEAPLMITEHDCAVLLLCRHCQRRGHPRVGGGKCAPRPRLTLSAGFFRKLNFRKILLDHDPPPGPPPWSPPWNPPGPPPLDPPPWTPHFFQFFFQFWTTGARFYIFFFYYITCVPLYLVVSLFLFTFFSIIEGSAVVLQPPQ